MFERAGASSERERATLAAFVRGLVDQGRDDGRSDAVDYKIVVRRLDGTYFAVIGGDTLEPADVSRQLNVIAIRLKATSSTAPPASTRTPSVSLLPSTTIRETTRCHRLG